MNNLSTSIATTCEQSERLLDMGVKPETADCYLEQIITDDWENYQTCTIESWMNQNTMFESGSRKPAWSLSRLISMMPAFVPDSKPGYAPHYPELIKNESGYILSIRRYTADYLVGTHIENDPIECCVSMIEWLIKNNHFNKKKERNESMITNTDPYYIMDSYLMEMVGESLRTAVTMAKAGYPHLANRMEFIEKEYREKLEGFKGSQNKPKTEKGLFEVKK